MVHTAMTVGCQNLLNWSLADHMCHELELLATLSRGGGGGGWRKAGSQLHAQCWCVTLYSSTTTVIRILKELSQCQGGKKEMSNWKTPQENMKCLEKNGINLIPFASLYFNF